MDKMVNGEVVLMTSQEEAKVLAEWSADELPSAIAFKIEVVKNEAITRMKSRLPGIKDMDTVDLIREFWLSIDISARAPTPEFQYVIDVHQAGKGAVILISAFTAVNAAQNYDAVTDPAWPV